MVPKDTGHHSLPSWLALLLLKFVCLIKNSTDNTKRDIAPLDVKGNREPDLFAAVIWSLWNQHNNLYLGKPALPLDKVLDFAW
nr:hypothetical protein CFP56_65124 [Quercus suber]